MTMTHQATIGQGLRENRAIREAIGEIVGQVRAASAAITGPRPPVAELSESYESLMARAGDVRGRALLYPYIGSGVGNGALVELADGRVVWDMITGIGVQFFGHSDPELIEEGLWAAIDNTLKHGNLASNFDAFAFAETLVAEAAKCSRLKHCFLSTSGALANEHALKLCHQKRDGAPRVLAFEDCFMGRTVTMSQIGDSAANRQGIPLSTLIDYMPFYSDAAARESGVKRHIDDAVAMLEKYIRRYPGQHACFVFELVQGEGGFNTAPREFFRELMEVCRAHDIPVWDDEIQTFGRTTSMFACDVLDLGDYVDVCTVGKMTQSCATLFTEDMNPKPGLLSGTFTGETPSFRIGKRIIERLRDGDFYGVNGRIARHHRLFREQAEALVRKHPNWFPAVPGVPDLVGGTGGMMRFTPFGGVKDRIMKTCRACFDAGVVVFYCGHGPFHVRMLPPLGVMREEDWPRVFECVEAGLSAV